MDKFAALHAFGRKRRASLYPGYRNLAEFHQGGYETDFVSPYTKSAGNVDAPIMFVLQDWLSENALRNAFSSAFAKLGHDPNRTTNIRLKNLLKRKFSLDLADVYVTNLFPFIKQGNVSASIPRRELDRALREFCWPEVQIVNPRAVVCLGSDVYNTFARVLGFRPSRGVGDYFDVGGRLIWHQYHPARRGATSDMEVAWTEMKHSLQRLLN